MKQGYDVFGHPWGVMMRNDVHAPGSVDHALMENMILLDDETRGLLYGGVPAAPRLPGHPLAALAESLRGEEDRESIGNALRYTSRIAAEYDVPFRDMRFGGREEEVLARGTDWCADMARVGAVLLMLLGIPARILHLADLSHAYYGHVVTEAYYEGKWGVCDFLHGYLFYGNAPLDAWELRTDAAHFAGYPADYAALYSAVAVSGYDPSAETRYQISRPNEYTCRIIETDHGGRWFMGEDGYSE